MITSKWDGNHVYMREGHAEGERERYIVGKIILFGCRVCVIAILPFLLENRHAASFTLLLHTHKMFKVTCSRKLILHLWQKYAYILSKGSCLYFYVKRSTFWQCLMSVDFLAICACVFWVVFASISKQSHLSKQTFDKILVDEDFYFSPPPEHWNCC